MIVALILCSIAVLDYPFNGDMRDMRVGPAAFELVLHDMEGS